MRCLAIGLALAAGALLLAATAADVPAQAGQRAADVSVTAEFDLPTSPGFKAEVSARDDQIILSIRGGKRHVDYVVHGELGETSIDASFGQLGQISFKFQPSETETLTPPPGCRGKPGTVMQGSFVGDASFRGEGGYATIEVGRVKGQVEVRPDRRCGKQQRPLARRGRREVGALRAFDQAGERFLLAVSNTSATGFYEAGFIAATIEHEEGMTIRRGAGIGTRRHGLFVFDHEAGTATVRPPSPFRGEGRFVRDGDASHPGEWRGDLSVSLLGHPPVSLAGSAFRATLNRQPPDFK